MNKLLAALYLKLRRLPFAARRTASEGRTVGVGTVRTSGERQIWIEVASVQGDTFVGRLVHDDGDPGLSLLRPGLVVLVAFDPGAREELSLPSDMQAVAAGVGSI